MIPSLREFGESFFRGLSYVMRKLSGKEELLEIFESISDELPPGIVSFKEVEENLIKRSRSGRLRDVQREILEKFQSHSHSDEESSRYPRFIPELSFFQVATGSGKTMLYMIIAYYYIINSKLRGRIGPKFIIATRSNMPEGVNVLTNLISFKVGLLLLLRHGYTFGYKVDVETLSRVVRDIIIGRFRGASNTPCIAQAVKYNFKYYEAGRTSCHRLRKAYSSSKKSQEKKVFKEVCYYSAGGLNFKSRRDLARRGKDLCPLLYDVVVSMIANIVVTNHAVILGSSSKEVINRIVLLNKRDFYDFSYVSRYLYYLLAINEREVVKDVYKDLKKLVPEETILIVDEADQFLTGLAKAESVSRKFKLDKHERNVLIYYIYEELEKETYKVEKVLSEEKFKGFTSIFKNASEGKKRILELLLYSSFHLDPLDRSLLAAIYNVLSSREIKLIKQDKSNRKFIPFKYNVIAVEENENISIGIIGEDASTDSIKRAFICPALAYLSTSEKSMQTVRKILSIVDQKEEVEDARNKLNQEFKKLFGSGFKIKKLLGSNPCSDLNLSDIKIFINIRENEISVTIARYRSPHEFLFEDLSGIKKLFFSATFPRIYLYLSILTPKYEELKINAHKDISRYVVAFIDTRGRTSSYSKEDLKVFIYEERARKPSDDREMIALYKRLTFYSREIKKLSKEGITGLILRPSKDEVRMMRSREIKNALRRIIGDVEITNISGDEEYKKREKDPLESSLEKAIEEAKKLVELHGMNSRKLKELEEEKKRLKERLKKELGEREYKLFVESYLGVRSYFFERYVEERIEYEAKRELSFKKEQKDSLRKSLYIYLELGSLYVLYKHIKEQLKRHFLVKRLKKKEKNLLLVATGAFSRGLDVGNLNLVIIPRVSYPPRKAEDEYYMRRFRNLHQAKSKIYSYFLKQIGIDVKEKEEEDLYRELRNIYAASTIVRNTVQALGRLTRGKRSKLALILDSRFDDYFKEINDRYREEILRNRTLMRTFYVGIPHSKGPLGYVYNFVKIGRRRD